MTDDRFKLSEDDKRSPLWMRLMDHLDKQLTLTRAQNDAVDLDERKTAFNRGKISEIKRLMALNESDPIID